jgi:hypothetical protein
MTKSWRSQFGNIKTLDFYNADIATAYEPIWDQGGAYTFPIAAGVQLSVASDDAASRVYSRPAWPLRKTLSLLAPLKSLFPTRS